MLSYSMVINTVSLRNKCMQASRDLKKGKKIFYETEIRYLATGRMTLWLRHHYLFCEKDSPSTFYIE
jgi:hypothetical protein